MSTWIITLYQWQSAGDIVSTLTITLYQQWSAGDTVSKQLPGTDALIFIAQ